MKIGDTYFDNEKHFLKFFSVYINRWKLYKIWGEKFDKRGSTSGQTLGISDFNVIHIYTLFANIL